LLAFDAQSTNYFSGVSESEALLNEGLTLLGGDPATGKVGAGSWNGQGFTPIVTDWQQRVNDQWSKRVERQEQARAAEFEQVAQGRTYQHIQLASGAYQWLWVEDPGKVTQEDLQFNEKYADYLTILNAPEENMVDEYYQNMLEELRTGINAKTGKALTTLEKIQRWSAVASFVAVLAIGSYYSVKGLTGTKTANQPQPMTEITVPKAKLPSDTTQGRQLKVKKADIPVGKSRNVTAPKKVSGLTTAQKVENFQNRIGNIRNKMPNSKLKNQGNMAIADVKIEDLPDEFIAHSKIHEPSSKGADLKNFSPVPENRIFKSYTIDKFPRYNDTEVKILEDIASKIKDPNISGKIDLYTELPACQSCTNVILEFRKKFPNIELNIFTK
jgi:hypothetical protein